MNHSNRSYASVLAPSSMTRSANGNKSVHNQQESHTQDAQQLTKAQAQPKQALAIQSLPQKKTASPLVMDIGINLTNKAFKNNWKAVIRRAVDAGVHRIVLTGTSIECSRESLRLAHQWYEEEGTPNLCVTVGVHPHHANSWSNKNSLQEMRKLLEDPLAVAVGECGLDYNRNFSSRSDQCRAFRAQLELAHELDYPVFIHEREAHGDLLKVLDEVRTSASDQKPLPKIVVHCFTGTQQEAMAYIKRGYYIGFTPSKAPAEPSTRAIDGRNGRSIHGVQKGDAQ